MMCEDSLESDIRIMVTEASKSANGKITLHFIELRRWADRAARLKAEVAEYEELRQWARRFLGVPKEVR